MERAIAFSIVDKKKTPSSAFSLSFLSLCCQTPDTRTVPMYMRVVT